MTDSGDVAHSQQADSEEADVRLTLNEAVGLLNCSRDFTLGLIARGEIDLTRMSVLAYRERDDAERKAAADEVTRLGQEMDAFNAALAECRQPPSFHYGEGVSSDATRTGREVGIPVCDDDGRELGEMRLSYANAGVLGAILVDAAEPVEMTTIESVDGRRWTSGGEGWVEHRFDKPSAHARALAIAAGDDTDEAPAVGTAAIPDGASHVEVSTDDGWVRADAFELGTRLAAMTVERDDLARELSKLQKRGNPDTWDRQASTIAKQAKEIGVLHDRIRDDNSADARAEKAEATLARIKAMAGRWQYVPGKKDAARDILAAIDHTPETK